MSAIIVAHAVFLEVNERKMVGTMQYEAKLITSAFMRFTRDIDFTFHFFPLLFLFLTFKKKNSNYWYT